ncbi:MAG: hypothetical protein IT377_33865 [Polyangiaceae bacterium]|nr:hypothetical protein [Polyangiaceae bacterium]
MKRQVWFLVTAIALGATGCAIDSGEPAEEGVGAHGAALGSEPSGGDPAPGGPAGTLGKPSEMVVTSGDPSGPTPYPWAAEDPSGGPTPYPWEEEADDSQPSDDGAEPESATTGSGATQTKTTSKH